MENTGRISRGLTPTARRILFGSAADTGIDLELEFLSQIDRAHLVMLAECGVIDCDRVRRLLREIEQLRASRFAPLRGRTAPRGLYLLYEDYLIEKLGAEAGGILQTARSRNDLNATVMRLRLRAPFSRLVGETLRLQAVLLRRARSFAEVVMPAYTHYQAAVPITYGHYCAGIAHALGRDISALFEAGAEITRCPLGAGAAGGTSLPIDPARTATLLGFDDALLHSLDAVASRDLVLRLLSSAAILGTTLSRLAADFLLWSTAEFGFLSLPDQLVGSSSMMPQKRNPFLLEHVQGRSTSALGGFMAAATAIHGKPFTNSVAVGTEAAAQLWKPLADVSEAATLARLVVAGAKPDRSAMLRRASSGLTSATELANRLVREVGMPFRSAHRTVGTLVRESFDLGQSLSVRLHRWTEENAATISLADIDPSSIVRRSVYGGGPGPESLDTSLRLLRAEWSEQMRRKWAQTQKWQAANLALDTVVWKMCSSTDGGRPVADKSN